MPYSAANVYKIAMLQAQHGCVALAAYMFACHMHGKCEVVVDCTVDIKSVKTTPVRYCNNAKERDISFIMLLCNTIVGYH